MVDAKADKTVVKTERRKVEWKEKKTAEEMAETMVPW